jgi:hypothetical protein
MMSLDLNALREQVLEQGPTRVIVSREGWATTPDRALREFGIVADVVFVRHDGWTLGAPRRWEEVARDLWAGSWVAVIDLDD